MATIVTRYVDPDSVGGDGTTKDLTGVSAAYDSLSAWEADRQRDLTAADEIEKVVCCSNDAAHTADSTQCIISTWTTDSTRYIDIIPEIYHAGVWNESNYRLEGSHNGINMMDIRTGYVRVTGLQIGNTSLLQPYAFGFRTPFADNADIRVSRCIVRAAPSPADSGIAFGFTWDTARTGSHYYRVWNNIIYGFGNGFYGINANWNVNVEAYNNTLYNCYRSVRLANQSDGSWVLKNNISYAGTSYDYNIVSVTNLTTSNNLSSDSTSPDVDYRDKTLTFKNVSGSDYHLAFSDRDAINKGVKDPGTGLFSDDIDGFVRTGAWCIGAHEIGLARHPLPGYRAG